MKCAKCRSKIIVDLSNYFKLSGSIYMGNSGEIRIENIEITSEDFNEITELNLVCSNIFCQNKIEKDSDIITQCYRCMTESTFNNTYYYRGDILCNKCMRDIIGEENVEQYKIKPLSESKIKI